MAVYPEPDPQVPGTDADRVPPASASPTSAPPASSLPASAPPGSAPLPPLRERRITLGHIPLRILSPESPAQLIDAALDEYVARETDGDGGAVRPHDEATTNEPRIDPPYWAEVWPAAIALGRRLIAMPMRGQRVLELGAGVGLAGLAAARAGARVLITDREPAALEVARRNARLNDLEVETRLLDWEQPITVPEHDWVIGADVIYEKENVEPLAELLGVLLARGGRALIADPGRPYQTIFKEALRARGLRPAIDATHFFWDRQARTVTLFDIERDA